MAGWGQIMEAPKCKVSLGNYVWCIHSICTYIHMVYTEQWGHCSMFHIMKFLLVHQILM